tara:strand:+ start:1158 stop:2378 length:1221 start_codon:yes stop_codon:yes gene_type:complete
VNIKLKNCRVCSSEKINIFHTLKKMPLGDKYSVKKNLYNQLLEINILKCEECNHIQTSTIPDRTKIYSNYLSRPAAINKNLAGQYLKYANDLKGYIKKDDLIIDIGSNDGAFLNFFKSNGYKNIVGVEPAKNLANQANKNKILTYNTFFNEAVCVKIQNKFQRKAKIILNNHSLSNVHDINEILFNVKSMLAKKGIYSIQTFYTIDVYNKNLLENFNHEHLNLFTVSSIDKLAKRHGLEVIKAFHIDAKGGSIRTYISHIGDYKVDKNVEKFFNKENKFLKSKIPSKKIKKFINNNSKEIISYIKKNNLKKIVGYGTSIGATTFITQYNLEKKINFLIDDDPYRQNLYSPGTNILTTDKKIIDKFKPDLVIVLAPLYFDNIFSNLKKLDHNFSVIKIWPKLKILKV